MTDEVINKLRSEPNGIPSAEGVTGKTTSICLNMIVRNESHIVTEVLDCVAPYIDYWVIVDTGSTDGTQELIRDYTRKLGIPGELHERPWRNFGANRTEALELAQGHSDYILIMDADDIIVGNLDLTNLTDDAYELRFGRGFTYWRPQILRDGLPWSYIGVVHEFLYCDQDTVRSRIHGDYYVDSRRLGGRNSDPEKYARDRDLLLAEVERDPNDVRSVFYLAQSCLDYGDPQSALRWYRRRVEMGGWDQEVYYSLYRIAECLAQLDEPWPVVMEAYLSAWAYRPTRAEPLYTIAEHYMAHHDWQLGYLFAERAAAIPMPDDILFIRADVYDFSARDVQAVCASWLGKHAEAFALCSELLARDDIEEHHKARIASNRNFSVPPLIEVATRYPDDIVQSLQAPSRDAEVTVTVTAGSERSSLERTLNSFLNCCTDIARIGRFVIITAGLSESDRAHIQERYPFCDFAAADEREVMAQAREIVGGRYWLRLESGWQFFAPDRLIARLTAVLEAEPAVAEVGINLEDADRTTGSFPSKGEVRNAGQGDRYVLTDKHAEGPAMYDTSRLNPEHTGHRGAATLDDVFAVRDDA